MVFLTGYTVRSIEMLNSNCT